MNGRNSRITSTRAVIENDPDIENLFPIPTSTVQLFNECREGLILCKLINNSVPDTIDTRVLNKPNARKPLNAFRMTENDSIRQGYRMLCLFGRSSAEGYSPKPISKSMLNCTGSARRVRLSRPPTADARQNFTPPLQLYHLKTAVWKRRVNNFSRRLRWRELHSPLKSIQSSLAPLQIKDVKQRAEQVLQNAEAIGCCKYLTPSSLISGNPCLNFVANLFNTWPGLEPLNEQEAKDYSAVAEREREARAFTLWLNLFGVEPEYSTCSKTYGIERPSVRQDLALLCGMAPRLEAQKWVTSRTPTILNGEEQENIGVTPTKALFRPKRVETTKSIAPGLFFLDLLDAMRPMIVDSTLVLNVSESGAHEDQRQNDRFLRGRWISSDANIFF
ncbi:calponin homology domain-containing protein [Suillus ampliporus]|nr:calponin homology domain-containing protein [Suillus ampliporus]